MLIHSMLPRSTVNGPGARAVVWLQGCGLRCPGCFNPATHPFDRDRDKTVEEVAERVLACEGIEGVTFSRRRAISASGRSQSSLRIHQIQTTRLLHWRLQRLHAPGAILWTMALEGIRQGSMDQG
ncbi:MAG: 4Fe-4S cluster-binding domain-containing protein [Acidobacteria bacterium]|nr:4Fe-4S cluster-binding domain-containing protein [Acidobacteriota bacterium]MBI3470881.1 4Fe-4S cluster-binding domain-containing protein [Candidatus Solibacter usitatus]